VKKIILALYLFFTSLFLQAQKIIPFYGPFPEPAPTKNMLFYLQRTVDRNTIIYEVNLDPSGEINMKKPIKIYWIDFDDGAKISPLTFVQSKFAYGINSELIDESKKIIELTLVSYKKIKLYLKQEEKSNHYQVHAVIKGKTAILSRIFVEIIGGTYLNPVVNYIELSGNDQATGKPVAEKFKP